MARRIVAGDRSKPKRVPAKSKPTGLRGGKPYEPDKAGQGTSKSKGSASARPTKPPAARARAYNGPGATPAEREAYRKNVKATNKAKGRRSY
jgi:hypothetical protein